MWLPCTVFFWFIDMMENLFGFVVLLNLEQLTIFGEMHITSLYYVIVCRLLVSVCFNNVSAVH